MRIVVLGQMASYVVAFRGDLLRSLVDAGHEVVAMAPEEDEAAREALAVMGVGYRRVPIERTGMDPIRDTRSLVSLARVFRETRPDMFLGTGAKPVIYGSLAARTAGVPSRIAMITGIGSALGGGGSVGRRALASTVRTLYQVALRDTRLVIFQNRDDEDLFRARRIIARGQRTLVVNGSGVHLGRYPLTPLPPPPMTFLMLGRLIRDKGTHEYVEGARLVRARHPEARFQLLGPLDSNPSAVSRDELDAWQREGVIEYLGETTDVRPYLAAAHVCVLPSYREGVPRSVLEAMSMGRPIVTTDVPGCRETVVDGRNGILVPAQDAIGLAAAMEWMVGAGPSAIETMAQESRAMAVARFDVHDVNRTIVAALGLTRRG